MITPTVEPNLITPSASGSQAQDSTKSVVSSEQPDLVILTMIDAPLKVESSTPEYVPDGDSISVILSESGLTLTEAPVVPNTVISILELGDPGVSHSVTIDVISGLSLTTIVVL